LHLSLGFSLGDYEQSLARLRRPGQTRMVRYYHMIAAGTVDETVYTALRERRDVVNAVLVNLTRRVEETHE
jgi:SNF2 family DNA or RNA helicase